MSTIVAEKTTKNILSEQTSGAGSSTQEFWIEQDDLVVSLGVASISGTLTLAVYTVDITGQDKQVLSFGPISAPTGSLIIKRATSVLSKCRIEAIYTDAVDYRVTVRSVGAAGDVSGIADGIEEALHVSNPTVFNLSLPVADTEGSYTLPAGTKKFSVFARERSRVQLSYTSGQSGTTFMTIKPGFEYVRSEIEAAASITIYCQSSKNGEVVEIESWS